jgi:hypothetical protein
VRLKLLSDDMIKLNKISVIRQSATVRLKCSMNDLIQVSVGDAMSWSNIEDAEVVKSPNTLNRRVAETSILAAVPDRLATVAVPHCGG